MAQASGQYLRIFSRRAPYTRGGVRFATTRDPVEFKGDAMPSRDQLGRLLADRQIRIEIHDPKSGQFIVAEQDADLDVLTQPTEAVPPPTTTAGRPRQPRKPKATS